jgi:Cu/Ag efflux protein CusF
MKLAPRAIWKLVALALLNLWLIGCRQPLNPVNIARPSPAAISTPAPTPSPIMNHPYPGTGVVRIINRKEGWIEIDHEVIKGLMPAMQMEFWLKNRSLVDEVNVGDRVEFTIVETTKGEFLTELKKVSPPAAQR